MIVVMQRKRASGYNFCVICRVIYVIGDLLKFA